MSSGFWVREQAVGVMDSRGAEGREAQVLTPELRQEDQHYARGVGGLHSWPSDPLLSWLAGASPQFNSTNFWPQSPPLPQGQMRHPGQAADVSQVTNAS